jgi:arylsulfatase A-like enzyme
LIRFFEDEHLELYDLRRDIREQHNLANALPDLAADLQARLNDWLQQVEAQFPRRNPAARP